MGLTVTDRFLKYVTFDTKSSEETGTTPSTPGQRVFAEALVNELEALGLEDISIAIIKTQDTDTLDNLKLVHRECVKLEELVAPVPMVVDLKNILNNKFNYFLLNDLTKQLPRVEEIDKVTINNPIDESTVLQVISPPRNSFKALDEYQKGVKMAITSKPKPKAE